MPNKWLVHWGFFQGYKKIQKNLYQFIEENKSDITTASIAGYSRGGTLAYFCGEDIKFKYPWIHIYDVITYGAPRGVDKRGKDIINQRVPSLVMYQYGNDAITKIPWWFLRPGKIVHLGPPRVWWKLSGSDHLKYKF